MSEHSEFLRNLFADDEDQLPVPVTPPAPPVTDQTKTSNFLNQLFKD